MLTRMFRLFSEAIFVIFIACVLKGWVFPFFSSVWFLDSSLSLMVHDFSILIFALLICYLYLCLGSSSRFSYRLSFLASFGVWGTTTALLMLLPYDMRNFWLALFTDGIALFLPGFYSVFLSVFVYLFFFLLGRMLCIYEHGEVVSTKASSVRYNSGR